MDDLARTLSKMFLVLVLLFGSPPVARLADRVRRPTVALVMPLRRRGGSRATNDGEDAAATAWPEAWPPSPPSSPARQQGRTERIYLPVRAA